MGLASSDATVVVSNQYDVLPGGDGSHIQLLTKGKGILVEGGLRTSPLPLQSSNY